MKRANMAWALVLLGAALEACSGGSGGASPSADDGGTLPGYDTEDGGVVSDDDGAVTDPQGADGASAPCVDGSTVDPPDDEGFDANCDGADGVLGVDVYVNAATGADTNPGTPTSPMRTVGSALMLATTRGGQVLLAGGDYDVASLSIPGTWAVYGGYAPSYLGPPSRELTTLHADATGLLIENVLHASLVHLTVQGDDPADPKQLSAHALRLGATEVTLDDVVVMAADGLPGAPGTAGVTGASGVTSDALTCRGVVEPRYALAPNVEGALPGNMATKVPAQSGGPGSAGTNGDNAATALALASGLVVGSPAKDGLSDGTPGFGGAPGGAGTVTSGSYAGDYTYGGQGGTGGCPGLGGGAGASGGSSVAVLVLSGKVTITRSLLQAGFGGPGGDGGEAGPGGIGGYGSLPYSQVASWFTSPKICTPQTDPLLVNCAAYGGQGGAGGAGGHGGGGAGGSTLGVLAASDATFTVDAATTFNLGKPGAGGSGGGSASAPSGLRLTTSSL